MTELSSWCSLTTMPPGQDVTLLYTQELDGHFIQSKDGAADSPTCLRCKSCDQHHQIGFSLNAVTSAFWGNLQMLWVSQLIPLQQL
jgi:hypothetical protein